MRLDARVTDAGRWPSAPIQVTRFVRVRTSDATYPQHNSAERVCGGHAIKRILRRNDHDDDGCCVAFVRSTFGRAGAFVLCLLYRIQSIAVYSYIWTSFWPHTTHAHVLATYSLYCAARLHSHHMVQCIYLRTLRLEKCAGLRVRLQRTALVVRRRVSCPGPAGLRPAGLSVGVCACVVPSIVCFSAF